MIIIEMHEFCILEKSPYIYNAVINQKKLRYGIGEKH